MRNRATLYLCKRRKEIAMTNAKDSTVDLRHLYPELLFVPSERYEKFYRDRYAAQKNIKNVRSYGDLFPFNPNFGITEK